MGSGLGVRTLVLRVMRAGKWSQAPGLETRLTTRQDPVGKGEGAPWKDRDHLAGMGHRGSQTLSHWDPLLRSLHPESGCESSTGNRGQGAAGKGSRPDIRLLATKGHEHLEYPLPSGQRPQPEEETAR